MSRKVVIIDDERWTRGVILKLAQWERLGLEVVGEAEDGDTGLELISRVQPDIVISDVIMPRIGGIELVQRLRDAGYSIPVLIISGYDDFSYVRGALRLGVVDYILKPIKAEDLNHQLARCVEVLNQEAIVKPKSVMEAGFFADGWDDIYSKIHKELDSALYFGNRAMIEAQFEALSKVVCDYEGEQPNTTVMIGIYYALIYSLQEYMDTIGANRNAVFGSKLPVFVFSKDNTMSQMLSFVQELYLMAVQYEERQQHIRTRLDIDAVCRYIQQKYANGITLEQTADVFHVSREYLSKAFKAEKQIGFAEYVTSLRMKRAYELIAEYDVPLKEVGDIVGYCDLAHFYKAFKKYYGQTPGELRKSFNLSDD